MTAENSPGQAKHAARDARPPRRPAPEGPRPANWFVGGLVVGVVLTLLAAAVVAALSDPNALEPGDLVIVSGRDDSIDGQRQKLVDEWNATHPGHRASIVPLPPIADAQRVEMLSRAQSATEQVDVYNLDVTWTAEFAEAGYLRNLEENLVPTDGFLQGPLSTCRYGGQLWALPFNADVGLLYYRSDLLQRLKTPLPPADWDTLDDQVTELHDLPATPDLPRPGDVAGYLSQLGDYEGLTVSALELIWGEGGEVADDQGRVLADDRDLVAIQNGLTRLRRLSPAGLPTYDESAGTAAFGRGEALFMRNWPLAYRTLRQPGGTSPGVRFDVTSLPGGTGALGGQNLAVAQKSRHPKAARALVEFLTGDRSEQILFERGGLPATRRIVYDDPQAKAVFPFADELGQALDTAARRRPAVPHYAQFSQEFRTIVDGYLRTPNASLNAKDFRTQLENALKGRAPADGH